MAMLTWSESLSVRIPVVDAQHMELVNMVNKLHDAMCEAVTDTVLNDIVADMRQYTEIHFGTEERYMQQFAYPDFDSHHAEHVDFIGKVTQVEKDCKSGSLSLSMDILNFLSGWLVTHIDGTDKKMGLFLEKHMN